MDMNTFLNITNIAGKCFLAYVIYKFITLGWQIIISDVKNFKSLGKKSKRR